MDALLFFKNKKGKVVSMTKLGLSRLSDTQKKELKKYTPPKVPKVLTSKKDTDES